MYLLGFSYHNTHHTGTRSVTNPISQYYSHARSLARGSFVGLMVMCCLLTVVNHFSVTQSPEINDL